MSKDSVNLGSHRELTLKNEKSSLRVLQDQGYCIDVRNGGTHLIVATRFDFWPGTGKYMDRLSGTQGRGVFNLLQELTKLVEVNKL